MLRAAGDEVRAPRMTVLRNAVANMAVITDGCQAGLRFEFDAAGPPLTVFAMACAARVAELLEL